MKLEVATRETRHRHFSYSIAYDRVCIRDERFRARLTLTSLPLSPPTQEQLAAEAPKEVFAFWPTWFERKWSDSGWQGTWSRALVEGFESYNATGKTDVHADMSGEGDGWGELETELVLAHFVVCPGELI